MRKCDEHWVLLSCLRLATVRSQQVDHPLFHFARRPARKGQGDDFGRALALEQER
jgi:hypothetical protein